MKNIILVGFMGTGKSVVGKLLAKKLNRDFLESDDMIEAKEKMPIKDIFEKKLEPYFRSVEKEAIKEALEHSDRVMVEEFIKGREATCGVVDNFRDEKHYALAPIEIKIASGKTFFDYDAKYSGKTREICPGDFSQAEGATIEEMSKEAHRALGLRHYSRSDFIITPKGKVYILETNSLPGMTAESLLPKALNTIGCSSKDFIDHIIKLAL